MHVAGHRVSDGRLEVRGSEARRVDPSSLDRADRAVPTDGADQHQGLGTHVLESLGNGHGPVVDLLDEDVGRPGLT